jgi:alpha-glucoside transport system substrate-binding protein
MVARRSGAAGAARQPPSRRDALKAFALPVLLTGCGTRRRGTVRVAVVWSGWELTAFRRVLDGFTRAYDWNVSVLPIGDDINALLGAQVARAAAPDVALLPRPGLVQEYQDRIVPLGPEVTAPFPEPWRRLVTTPDGAVRGIWFKTAHKSMVWYRPDVFARRQLAEPRDWAGWQQVNDALARAGESPLALGAADGWVLSDWFENVLLGLDPDRYHRLAETGLGWRAESVPEALRLIGEMWATPGIFPGGVDRALLTQFEDAVVDVCNRGRAAMVVQGDFAYPVIGRYAGPPPVRMSWFPFPAPPGGRRPVVAGGDIAVLLRQSRAGEDLITWLASAEAAEIWAEEGGFISVHRGVNRDVYPPAYTQALLDEVRDGMDGRVAFDLSDQLTGRLGGGDGRGLWRVLQDFLAEVAAGGSAVRPAAERAVDTLARLAGE